MSFVYFHFFFTYTICKVLACIVSLGGILMFLENEDDLQEEHDDDEDEGIELKTISISDSIKMRREQREKRNKEFEDKLKVLQDKTDRLKRELGYSDD